MKKNIKETTAKLSYAPKHFVFTIFIS